MCGGRRQREKATSAQPGVDTATLLTSGFASPPDSPRQTLFFQLLCPANPSSKALESSEGPARFFFLVIAELCQSSRGGVIEKVSHHRHHHYHYQISIKFLRLYTFQPPTTPPSITSSTNIEGNLTKPQTADIRILLQILAA